MRSDDSCTAPWYARCVVIGDSGDVMREVTESRGAAASAPALRGAAHVALWMWLLGCAGAADDTTSKPAGAMSANSGSGMSVTGGSGAAMMPGGSGSAAGSTATPIGGGSGTVSAGSGGSVTTTASGFSAASSSR
jgi:hypothetical protein